LYLQIVVDVMFLLLLLLLLLLLPKVGQLTAYVLPCAGPPLAGSLISLQRICWFFSFEKMPLKG
jgi:hypothetical protein